MGIWKRGTAEPPGRNAFLPLCQIPITPGLQGPRALVGEREGQSATRNLPQAHTLAGLASLPYAHRAQREAVIGLLHQLHVRP